MLWQTQFLFFRLKSSFATHDTFYIFLCFRYIYIVFFLTFFKYKFMYNLLLYLWSLCPNKNILYFASAILCTVYAILLLHSKIKEQCNQQYKDRACTQHRLSHTTRHQCNNTMSFWLYIIYDTTHCTESTQMHNVMTLDL